MLNYTDIKHGFGKRSHNLVELFDETNLLSTFMRKLEKQSLVDPQRYDSKKYLGDGFEFFVEIFLKSHAYDNRVGITNYEPIQSQDHGVDGVGINLSGEKSVVQIKYRSNNKTFLTNNEDNLGNMINCGMIDFDVIINKDKEKAPRHYIITTAQGLHHYTDQEMYKGFVHCIGHDQLKSMLDNNLSFWNLCREISKGIIEEIEKQKQLTR
jgi:hypothetical protein